MTGWSFDALPPDHDGWPTSQLLADGHRYLTVAGLMAVAPGHPLLGRPALALDDHGATVRVPIREFPAALIARL